MTIAYHVDYRPMIQVDRTNESVGLVTNRRYYNKFVPQFCFEFEVQKPVWFLHRKNLHSFKLFDAHPQNGSFWGLGTPQNTHGVVVLSMAQTLSQHHKAAQFWVLWSITLARSSHTQSAVSSKDRLVVSMNAASWGSGGS